MKFREFPSGSGIENDQITSINQEAKWQSKKVEGKCNFIDTIAKIISRFENFLFLLRFSSFLSFVLPILLSSIHSNFLPCFISSYLPSFQNFCIPSCLHFFLLFIISSYRPPFSPFFLPSFFSSFLSSISSSMISISPSVVLHLSIIAHLSSWCRFTISQEVILYFAHLCSSVGPR